MSAPILRRRLQQVALCFFSPARARGFRSDAALKAVAKAREDGIRNLILYNYPSFSGAFSALFAHRFHSRLCLPFLVLPYSSAVPLRAEDLYIEGLQRCYLLDFAGPRGFAAQISRRSMCEVIAFEHRKSAISRIRSPDDDSQPNVRFCVDHEKSSSRAAYNYFADKLAEECKLSEDQVAKLLNAEDEARVETILSYIEDSDLLRWSLPDVRAFNIGFSEWRQRINCITNPYMFEELLELTAADLIAKGNSHISSDRDAATKLLDIVFKVRLGRGFYGECLGVRADGNSKLSELLGKELSVRSAAVGLRPIGAVVYMHRNNLKMCLRSTDASTDTSEVAKAYGGGGSPSSSSFMIRMDEYNQWLSANSS
ncbi:unnamed protein product [Linum tenue]|uniref:Uncharacterized protein n=1 Tax=Linum tenue TaxID=586396 RepID=A0AAV0PKE8_9ROSI|nr:unnamed protein product [Linum tenue]